MNCEQCEYYNKDEGVCGSFQCNGIECPTLPCEQVWIFTFGCGQEHAGHYVKVKGTFHEARNKMIDKYGIKWGFQYSEEEWDEWLVNKPSYIPVETELEVIE